MARALLLILVCLPGCGPPPPPASTPTEPAPERVTADACLDFAHGLEHAAAGRSWDQQRYAARSLLREIVRVRPHRPEGLARCEQQAERLLAELAAAWQEAGSDQADLEHAVQLIRLYLKLFPRGDRSYALAYRRAELLYKLRRWREAAAAFGQVVELDRRGRHAREAAYSAVLALGRVVEPGPKTRPPSRPPPLPPVARELVQACQRYLELFPRGTEWVPVLYRQAQVFYDHYLLEQALSSLKEIVLRHADHPVATQAAGLMLDTLNQLGREAELRSWVDRLRADPRLGHGELAASLPRIKRVLERRAIERLARGKQYGQCARRYAALADQDPQNPRWAELVYNAAVCHERDGKHLLAIGELKRLLHRRPEHQLAPRAALLIAQHYEALGRKADAALHYEKLALKYPGETSAPDALESATALRIELGQVKQALADARSFARAYGRRFARRTARITFVVGQLLERRGQPRAVQRHYQAYLKRWSKAGGPGLELAAHAKLARALWSAACPGKQTHGVCGQQRRLPGRRCSSDVRQWRLVARRPGKVRAARRHLQQAEALADRGKSTGEPLAAAGAAEARFLAAELQLEPYLTRGFPAWARGQLDAQTRRRLAAYLTSKGKALDQLQQAYDPVLQSGQPIAIAALARAAQLVQHFAEVLLGAPIPGGSPPAEQVYCRAVADKAAPLLQQAAEGFTACLDQARKAGIDNAWTALCKAELNRTKLLQGKR